MRSGSAGIVDASISRSISAAGIRTRRPSLTRAIFRAPAQVRIVIGRRPNRRAASSIEISSLVVILFASPLQLRYISMSLGVYTMQPRKHSRKGQSNKPVRRFLKTRSVTGPSSVTVAEEERDPKRYTEAELSTALEILNKQLRPPSLSDPLDDAFDIGDARRDEEAYVETLDRVSRACITITGRLMALLNPHALHTEASKELADKRSKAAIEWADLFGALETVLREDWGRFRACPICSRLFVPRRVDQSCCSKPCAGVARIRRHRAKQAQYEYNRKLKSAGLKPARERKR